MSLVVLALLLLASLLVTAELAAPGVGAAGAGGAACLVAALALAAGDPPGPRLDAGVAIAVLGATVVAVGATATRLVRRQRDALPASGVEALVGHEVTVRHPPGSSPQGFLAGAWWSLRAADGTAPADGARVWVSAVDGLVLVVEPVDPPEGTTTP